jgi:flagellar biosynthetic protein FlhB
MADRDEKILPALPQKRKRAREEGNVARSRELTAAASFLLVVIVIAGGGAMLGRFTMLAFRNALRATRSTSMGAAAAQALARPVAAALAFASLIAVGAVIGATAQDGFVFAPARLAPDPKRLNPLSYFGRTFSVPGLVELAKAAVKIVVIAAVGWQTARWTLRLGGPAGAIGAWMGALEAGTRRLLYITGALALVVGGVDYAHKRYEFESDLRMTRQEFRDELRQEEGDPHVKRAIRRAQRKTFKRIRGLHQAATASVVLTNPTHYAVALRYRRGFDQAPLIVAKGAGENALRIIAIARLAAVPVVENKPLARALYKVVEVGDFIPRQFYRAIAEVLAAIMRAERARKEAGIYTSG